MDDVGGETRREVGPIVAALPERLDHLFRTVHPADRGEYSYREVASMIEASGGPTISAAYINYLRLGRRNNPTIQHLAALADFFGVPVSYFTDAEMAERVDLELDFVAAARDGEFDSMAMRAFIGETEGNPLDAETIHTLLMLRDEIRKRRARGPAKADKKEDPA